MADRKNPFGNIRIVYRRSSKLVKSMVLVTLVFATAALLFLGAAIRHEKLEYEAYRQQAAALEQENTELSQQIDELGTVEAIKRLAQKWLGLVDPDTVIFESED